MVKKTSRSQCGHRCEGAGPSCSAVGGDLSWCRVTVPPSRSPLGVYPGEGGPCPHTGLCVNGRTSLFLIAPKWKPAQASHNVWVRGVWPRVGILLSHEKE